MKVYTKTGDKGTTSLVGGTRVAKNSPRLEAYGTIDELNSYLGMLRSLSTIELEKEFIDEILIIQSRLFDIGACLATESEEVYKIKLSGDDVAYLEKAIDKMSEELPPIRFFILPGGGLANSYAHLARTVCRRAERRIIDLSETCSINELVITYINRLSDYLFVLSRYFTLKEGGEEAKWIPN